MLPEPEKAEQPAEPEQAEQTARAELKRERHDKFDQLQFGDNYDV